MAKGVVATATLLDIANAIRAKGGTSAKLKPGDMAAAVTALDGTDAGGAETLKYIGSKGGLVEGADLSALADAIRAKGGTTAKLKPGEMAAAIRALTFASGPVPRAVLLRDGTLEFNCLDGVRSTTGGEVASSWQLDPVGYTSAMNRPWDADKKKVKKAVIDSSMKSAGVKSSAYWFNGMESLTSVTGLESLAGVEDTTMMFASCPWLESVFATSFDNSTIKRSSSMFYGCNRLVGGTGTCPTSTSDAKVCKLGSGGVLTDPANDTRTWVRATLFSDGELVISSGEATANGRDTLAAGRLCPDASYKSVAANPVYDQRSRATSLTFADDLAGRSVHNLGYWFYGFTELTDVRGLYNLTDPWAMEQTFNGCTGLVTLDMTGMSTTNLVDIPFLFAGCKNLKTIYAQSGFYYQYGATYSANAFYNCTSLVGGRGTAYSPSLTSGVYMRVDGEMGVGYLTARS